MKTPFVVAGVEDIGTSLIAVDCAAEEASLRGWPLRLVHALDRHRPADPSSGFGLLLAAAARVRHRRPSLAVSTVLGVGSPTEVLPHYVGDNDLLVLGNHGRGELSGIYRSVALHLLPRLHVPILVVRVPGFPDLRSQPPRPVVVGADGTPAAQSAVLAAIEEARLRSAPLIAVHATTSSVYTDREADPLRSGPLADESLLAGLTVSTLRPETDPRAALVDLSRQASLVVVGRRKHRSLAGYLLGSVSQTLVHRAHCPVLVTPAPAKTHAHQHLLTTAHDPPAGAAGRAGADSGMPQ